MTRNLKDLLSVAQQIKQIDREEGQLQTSGRFDEASRQSREQRRQNRLNDRAIALKVTHKLELRIDSSTAQPRPVKT